MTNHIQVANRIENFVFDKLIAITQTFGIEDFIFIQNNRVGEIAALRQTQATQGLHVLNETKGARA